MANTPTDSITAKVAEKRAEITMRRVEIGAIERKIEVLTAEVCAYEDALRMFGSPGDGADVTAASLTQTGASAPEATGADRRRGPKGAWRIIMPELLRMYEEGVFVVQDVVTIGELTGANIKTPTVRSQMANYVTAGLLARVKDGRFTFTENGRAAFADLSDRPSKLRLVTDPPAADDVQAAGVSPESLKRSLEASNVRFSVGGVPR